MKWNIRFVSIKRVFYSYVKSRVKALQIIDFSIRKWYSFMFNSNNLYGTPTYAVLGFFNSEIYMENSLGEGNV